MKSCLRNLMLAALFLIGQQAFAETLSDKFEARAAELSAQVDKGAVSEVASAKELADMAKRMFPTDYNFHALRDYRILIASRLERGDIKREEFDYLWTEKKRQYHAERDRLDREYASAERQQQADDGAARARAVAAFAGSLNRSTETAARSVGARCTSNAIGGTLFTNCN